METETSEMHRSFKTKQYQRQEENPVFNFHPVLHLGCTRAPARGRREGGERGNERGGGRWEEGKEGGKGVVAATEF